MDAADDTVIEEIRRSRRKMSERCARDVSKFIDYMKGFNGAYAEQIRRFEKERGSTRSDETSARTI